MYYYNPTTKEYIPTNDPADWMSTTKKAPPVFDPQTQSPFWTGTDWDIVTADPEPAPDIDALRKAAYKAEADPLYFKAMRQEIDIQQWHDKVAEIRLRYPKETE